LSVTVRPGSHPFRYNLTRLRLGTLSSRLESTTWVKCDIDPSAADSRVGRVQSQTDYIAVMGKLWGPHEQNL